MFSKLRFRKVSGFNKQWFILRGSIIFTQLFFGRQMLQQIEVGPLLRVHIRRYNRQPAGHKVGIIQWHRDFQPCRQILNKDNPAPSL